MLSSCSSTPSNAELDPENLDYRYNQRWYALAAGDFEKARQEARKTLQINPSYPKAFVGLAPSDLARAAREVMPNLSPVQFLYPQAEINCIMPGPKGK